MDYRYASLNPSDYYRQLGALHMPPDKGTCEDALTVIEVDNGNEICAATCDDQTPCPLEEILESRKGVCRLIETE